MFQILLEKIAQELDAANLRYMVIGGQAVLLYGEPRLTIDIDITLGATPERLSDLQSLVDHCGWQALPENPKQFVTETMVLPCLDPESGIRLDFIFSHSTFEAKAIERARRISVLGTEVCYASPEDLVVFKIVAGRPRDIEDVRSVLLKNPALDHDYIIGWLEEFDKSMDEGFVTHFNEVRNR